MRKLLMLAALVAVVPAELAAKDTYVKGYVRSDGTYVQPHVRSSPNETKLDNYSTQPNVNPYTGKTGTVDPYKPSASNPSGTPVNKTTNTSNRKSSYGY